MLHKRSDESEKPIFESGAIVRPRWNPRTWAGLVIRTMSQSGRPLTWKEIQRATGLNKKSLNRALFELLDSKDIEKIPGTTYGESAYKLSDVRIKTYSEFYNPKPDLVKWIQKWKALRQLDFSIEHEHFFLEGRHLDDFSKELISRAKFDVLIANPYIQDCDLSNMLIEASRNEIDVQVITRPPESKLQEYLERKQEYHVKLKDEAISISYDNKVHVKLIVVDRAVAIISSMNFYAGASAGASWEAGLVSIDQKVVNSIANSFYTVQAEPHIFSSKN
jgi:phosphatidylserine/phosphatidylglycerophosphate/cardiolipin synthase-like enzyme